MKNYILLDKDFCDDYQLSVINHDKQLIFDDEFRFTDSLINRLKELYTEYKVLICNLERTEYDKLRKQLRKQHSLNFHCCHIEDMFDEDDLTYKRNKDMSIYRFYRSIFQLKETRNRNHILKAHPQRSNTFADIFRFWGGDQLFSQSSRGHRVVTSHVDDAVQSLQNTMREHQVSQMLSRINPFVVSADTTSTYTNQVYVTSSATRGDRPVRVVLDEPEMTESRNTYATPSTDDREWVCAEISAANGDVFHTRVPVERATNEECYGGLF